MLYRSVVFSSLQPCFSNRPFLFVVPALGRFVGPLRTPSFFLGPCFVGSSTTGLGGSVESGEKRFKNFGFEIKSGNYTKNFEKFKKF